MKLLKAVLALLGVLTVTTAFAQTATDELETARAQIHADRKAVVSKLMNLTEQEGTAFWPVYNEFRESMRKVDDRFVALMKSYDTDAPALTDQHAQQMLNEFLSIQSDKAALKKSYVKKFTKALPASKMIRYYQIENKMDAVIQYELAAGIPLVG